MTEAARLPGPEVGRTVKLGAPLRHTCYDLERTEPVKTTTDAALASLRAFLQALISSGKRLGWHDGEVLMAARDRSVLTFTDAERADFYRVIATISRAAYARPIAEETLRHSVESALFHCLSVSAADVAERLDAALSGARRTLVASERTWRVAFRIQWLKSEELPFRYRSVHFVPSTREAVLNAMESNRPPAELDHHIFQFLPEASDGLGVAVVDVDACDLRSARAIALDAVHAAVDELTGFTTLVSNPSSPILTDVMNALPVSLVTLSLDNSADDLRVDLPMPMPWDGVKPRSLFCLLGKCATPSRLSAITGAGTDDVIERTRSAARFIGRGQQATFQHRTADAFLYYVIALEALLGRKDFRESIGYQLRMRVAHLIGRSAEERGQIELDVVRLYDVRSKLAHVGVREVRALDITQARDYAVRALAKTLFVEPWRSFTKFAEFEAYFRERLLA